MTKDWHISEVHELTVKLSVMRRRLNTLHTHKKPLLPVVDFICYCSLHVDDACHQGDIFKHENWAAWLVVLVEFPTMLPRRADTGACL